MPSETLGADGAPLVRGNADLADAPAPGDGGVIRPAGSGSATVLPATTASGTSDVESGTIAAPPRVAVSGEGDAEPVDASALRGGCVGADGQVPGVPPSGEDAADLAAPPGVWVSGKDRVMAAKALRQRACHSRSVSAGSPPSRPTASTRTNSHVTAQLGSDFPWAAAANDDFDAAAPRWSHISAYDGSPAASLSCHSWWAKASAGPASGSGRWGLRPRRSPRASLKWPPAPLDHRLGRRQYPTPRLTRRSEESTCG